MDIHTPVNNIRQFNGTIGQEILAYNWSSHSLGPIDQWPISLCLYIQMILKSKTPMFLLWGRDNSLFINESFQEIGIELNPYDSPIGKTAREYFKEYWDIWENRLESLHYQGNIFFREDILSQINRLPYQKETYRSYHISPILNEEGENAGILFLIIDTSEKVLAFKNLEENQRRLSEAINSVEMGTFEYRIDTEEMIPSERFINLMGGKKGMTREQFVNLLHPDYVEVRNKAYQEALKTGNLKYQARTLKDPTVWVEVEGKIYYDSKGNPSKMVGTIFDITREKNAELELLESKSHLEKELLEKLALQKQKDEFLQVASHELKTPLTAIRGYAQLVEEILLEKKLDSESKMLGKLNLKIDHLNSLVQNLFDVTQLNIGKLDFVENIFELTELLRFLTDDFRYIRSNNYIREDYSFKGLVKADRERISQVITNLISNAIKYSTPRSEIFIQTRKVENQIAVDIIDKGIGIAPIESSRIFEQFYRSPNALSPKYSGLGLGLYISSQIIERQGGKIEVKSTLGKGSTFTFSLPIYNP